MTTDRLDPVFAVRADWLTAQSEALIAAVNGAPLEISLGALARAVTGTLGAGVRAAFYVSETDGTPHHVAGLSEESAREFNGVGCRFPIHSAVGAFAGTLALHWPDARAATAHERELAELATATAAIIIARHHEARARNRAEIVLRESEAHLSQELEDARVLQQLSNQLVSEAGPGGHYNHIVEVARTLMRSDAASVQELEAVDSRLKLLAHTGFHAESAAFWAYVHADVGSSCGRALAARTRVVVPDIDTFEADPHDIAAYRKSGIMSVQSTPLVASSGRMVGMLSTHWNHPHTPGADGYRFFDILARVTADAMERARTEAALRESESKFRAVFETMIEACCIFDMIYDDRGKPVDWKILEANPGYETQSGLKDVAGRLASEVMPGSEAYWTETFGRVADTGEAEQIEKWHQPTERWIHSSTARVGGAGSRRLVSVFYDISERKRAEIALRESEARLRILVADRDELLKELHHRVKNNLQVVTSLLEMQARQIGDRQALTTLTESRNRITAIAAIHELLYQSGSFSEIDLPTYTRRLVGHVASLYDAKARITASIEGEAITIDLARAVPLGLLINELVSNAYKHAFRSRTDGVLRVAVDRLDGQIRVRVSDTGVGLPTGWDDRTSKTLGLHLVRMLAKQLSGTVTFSSAGGAVIEVRVPESGKLG